MTKIINIIGQKESGKTFLTGELIKYYLNEGYSVSCDSFAGELKKIIEKYFHITKTNFPTDLKFSKVEIAYKLNCIFDEYFTGYIGKETFLSTELDDFAYRLEYLIKKRDVRKIMQFMGTEFFRRLDMYIWIKILDSKIKYYKTDFLIISDCRFINEFEMLNHKKFNTKNIYIFNKNHSDSDIHPSESGIFEILKKYPDKINYEFDNTDFRSFQNNLKKFLYK